MNLLVEVLNETKSTILTEETGKKEYYIEGIFLQSNQKNKNGRVYPKPILKEEVNRYIKECINMKRSLGELNHPSHPDVNPERASHLILSLREDGDNWIGKAKVLNTTVGICVKNLLDEGVNLGVSSRGLGTLQESNGVKIVQSDYQLSTIDIVGNPSAADAWVQGIMEKKEWIWDNGILVEKEIQNIQDTINKSKPTEKQLVKMFELYMNAVSRGRV
jgi:hypothetical protein